MRSAFPLSRMPIRHKLLISYLLLVLTPVALIGGYAYFSSVRTVEEQTRGNLEVAIRQIASNIEYRIRDITRGPDEIYADQTLSRYLTGYHSGWEKYSIMSQYVLPRLENAANLPSQEVKLTLYVDNPDISEYYYTDTNNNRGGRQYSLFKADRIKDKGWYKELNMHYGSHLWRQVEDDEATGSISYFRPLINFDTLGLMGLVKMTVSMNDIFSDAGTGKLGEESLLFVVDDHNRLLYSSTPDNSVLSALSKGGGQGEMIPPDSYMQIKETIPNLPVSVVAWVPYSSLQEKSDRVRDVTIAVCAASLLVLMLISLVMSQYFSRRFSNTIASLRSFKEGNFQKRMPSQGGDEFAQIGSAFNEMASTIQRLINEVYVSNLEKKESELQVLHSQMNPHFLYNTFSSISRMAKLGEIDKLHEVLRELARFYRLSLHHGERLVSVEQELQIVKAYLDIQRIKNGDRIHAHYDISPDVLGCETTKFVLQPFVENSLEHAWYDDEITIWIRAYVREGAVCLEVEDNGLGMKQEIVSQILDPTDKGIGYGIRNVNQRVKLQYGAEYGVRIESSLGEGTLMRITLPLRIKEEAAGNAPEEPSSAGA
ncbi:sensor histidine kinase [Paenibacillus sp. HN-1]|uniref:sensor histidine kinase n=1 Tax=Paenibacillus TaxID=44249 RepID=UPI001CA923A5|nr:MULTISPECIES: sensor histidine kinase [Paenibacillus]MBY9079143.1 sensor histidine kinase [Paenibacillus sp. CGMCC 1.18879]MBY9086921.1 sensor histidine kinase [Paenibacillus sinensis]